MTKIQYRVECNHGSKYFDNGIVATAYYQLQVIKGHYAELWLVVKETSPKLWAIKQELLDCSHMGGVK